MSQHIGLIFCAYGTKDYVHQSLRVWLDLRAAGHQVTICAVNVRFAGFEGEDDGTREVLRGYLERGYIDNLIDGPDNVPEAIARGTALQYLRDKVDLIWMVDSDEFYTMDEINSILRYMEENPWIAWARLCFKNYVMDDKTYLAEPFTPPRVFRVWAASYRVHSFSGDNDIAYGGTITRDILSQERFASATVPKEIAWVKHLTWQSNDRSRRKIAYQTARWGNVCSFAWDDTQGGLIFNPALPRPKVIQA